LDMTSRRREGQRAGKKLLGMISFCFNEEMVLNKAL
jgi:hypothetical protein